MTNVNFIKQTTPITNPPSYDRKIHPHQRRSKEILEKD